MAKLRPIPDHPLIRAKLVRHVKTGGEYLIIGSGYLEADLSIVVTYMHRETETLWTRPFDEFVDGRFVEIE